MISACAELNRGMVVDVPVRGRVSIKPTFEGQRIVITVEDKSGRLSRLRIQSDGEVRIEPPNRKQA